MCAPAHCRHLLSAVSDALHFSDAGIKRSAAAGASFQIVNDMNTMLRVSNIICRSDHINCTMMMDECDGQWLSFALRHRMHE
jgi:hypothetical protein